MLQFHYVQAPLARLVLADVRLWLPELVCHCRLRKTSVAAHLLEQVEQATSIAARLCFGHGDTISERCGISQNRIFLNLSISQGMQR